ncbi:sugar isomerase [Pedobacter helvus]|uniref:Sugar isomerase n=1 Tax=Pedobacter helvus TaxID=2563444 RepID=A0ABW9JPE2_9SPHI|nr:sugar isomerase [Pedobacter ureilyticus]
MNIEHKDIALHNETLGETHQRNLNRLKEDWGTIAIDQAIAKLVAFQIAIPSWALGTGGTRFGRFAISGGEPRTLEEKIEDVGLLHQLNAASGAISLHIPWDIPTDVEQIKKLAHQKGLLFDAVNSNTFQDQPNAPLSYKFGSLQHVNKAVRQQAIAHNIEVIKQGDGLGSKALTVWLADGSCFPGQLNFRNAFENTLDSLQQIYSALPSDWTLLVEYKGFEPNFYSTTIADWGQSMLLANKLGAKAKTLVDLGHHLPNANIEQIVALLLMESKLGGFHFNDSKYGDDDLTAGAVKPYQLFLIFNELVEGMDAKGMNHAKDLGWMIDASHNVKDPLEDLLQSVEAIMLAYAQALMVDREALVQAQQQNDVAQAQEILQHTFRSDFRALVAEARLRANAALNPLQLYRTLNCRAQLINKRGKNTTATGL